MESLQVRIDIHLKELRGCICYILMLVGVLDHELKFKKVSTFKHLISNEKSEKAQ